MVTERCQALWDEFRKATTEWTEAAEAALAFIVMEPVTPGKEIPSVPQEEYEEMAAAYKKENLAHRRYMDAYRAWGDCRRSLPGKHRAIALTATTTQSRVVYA